MTPYVVCHMMGPLDGGLVVSRWSASTGRTTDALVADYERVHRELKGDAWIAGRSVGAEFATGEPQQLGLDHPATRPLHISVRNAAEYAIIIDPHGKLHWSESHIDDGAIFMVLGPTVADAHLARLAALGISYFVMPSQVMDLRLLLRTLADNLGIKRLLLEGGAATNAAFFKAGLVDEVSLLLFPAIGGHSDARSLFESDKEGLAEKMRLEMISTEVRSGSSVHLRYKVYYSKAIDWKT
ncbi:dihydrofolate reductase family protein [Novosphingobium sp.]|uniref:RibD family protein n=1 Tax=Novosphingobium sp. TaxID=1874826 RepID=UPI0028ADDA83|nr:dihydrofolate reductase family protein [Novosphingobium sp.]